MKPISVFALAIACLTIGVMVGKRMGSTYVVAAQTCASAEPNAVNTEHKTSFEQCGIKLGACDPIPR